MGKQASRQAGREVVAAAASHAIASRGDGEGKKKALVWEESFCLLAFLALLLQCLPGCVWNRRKAL